MKKKWVRCILGGLMVCSVVFAFTACGGKDADTDVDKDDTAAREVVENYVAESNSNAAHVEAMKVSDTLIPGKTEEMFQIDAPTTDISGSQGGCTDGTYYYQAFYRNDGGSEQANNECIIMKYDIAKGEVVDQTEILQLNHVNDMTYNSKIGLLVVCHNAPFANLLSYVDPETMDHVDTFTIDEFIYSIGYSAERDQYMVGISGGQTFKVLDADFKAAGDEFQPTDRSSGCTTQGGTCDDDFIYFALYKPNLISVYDWDGNFVTIIEVPEISQALYEPENMTVIDGEIYFGCASIGRSKTTVFKLTDFIPKPAEEVVEDGNQ